MKILQMKTSIFLLSVLSTIMSLNALGQTGKLNKDTIGEKTTPLYVVKLADGRTSPTSLPVLRFVGSQHIAAMEIYKDAKSIELYGNKAKNGVIIITLKKKRQYKHLESF
ncbi:hypothetical protein [Mucilaginibacter antarcticus]|uniref:hypothetical protein n=1 Tax=Mucilaginibacter antarcticus TaxID=1855725 RepID=UPI0036355BE5